MRKTTHEQKTLFASAASVAAIALVLLAATLAVVPAAAERSSAGSGHSDGHGTPRENTGSPPDPDCWGEVTSTLTQADDGSPGIGEHASDPIPGDGDRETPRRGIGNNFPGDDTPSEHGATVSAIDGNPETNCEADRND